MIRKVDNVEIEHEAPDWMIRFAFLAKTASRISIRHFNPGSAELSFVSAICNEHCLSVETWTDDAFVVKRQSNT